MTTFRHSLILGTGTLLLAACSAGQPFGMATDHSMMNHGMMRDDAQVDTDGTSTLIAGSDIDLSSLPEAKGSAVIDVADGETIDLNPQIVKKTINGKTFAFYAYNGQFPGPLLRVKQGATFTVHVKNDIDQPTSIHWHGIRLNSKDDGAVGLTQDAIPPNGSFSYTVTVPDEGLFWYHPHVREDVQQDLGLYGGILVTPRNPNTYAAVDNEQIIMLDDILLGRNGLPLSYGKTEADHALMGRFGNTFLVNGTGPKPLEVGLGTTARISFLNASNTRTYRIVKPAGSMFKIVGGDSGRYEQEYMADSYTLSPSERVSVELYFWDDSVNRGESGTKTVALVESGPPTNPLTVLPVTVVGGVVGEDRAPAFRQLRRSEDVAADIATLKPFFAKQPDHTIRLSIASKMMGGMQHQGMMAESPDGIEWEDSMAHMNAMSTKANVQWKLIDEASKAENMNIAYTFKKGDKVKIRLVNDKDSAHPMQHPIHFHGQRFLVLSDNGVENKNLVWKDTVLVPAGHTVDILLEASNPGDWMFHCHIAEHLTNGMMGVFRVQ